MKSAILVGTTMLASTSVLADPVAEKRNLGDWGGTSNLAGGCEFRSPTNLFAHSFTAAGVSSLSDDGNFESPESNDVGIATYAAWRNTDLQIARFGIDLSVTNYAAAQSNYKYYDYIDDDWATTSLDATGDQNMVMICVYKKKHSEQLTVPSTAPDSGVCTAGDLLVEVGDGAADDAPGGSGTPVVVDVGVRKLLGVATTCGTGVGGDIPSPHAGLAADIFAWADLVATDQLTFELSYTISQQTEAANTLSHVGVASTESIVTYTLSHSSTAKVHDILLISGEEVVQPVTGLFTNSPDVEYNVDYGDEGPFTRASGQVTATMTPGSVGCTLSLSVDVHAGDKTKMGHCFRNEAARQFPNANSEESTNGTKTDDVDNTFISTTALATTGNCKATLQVNCAQTFAKMKGEDNRLCNVPAQAGISQNDRYQDYVDCTAPSWFTTDITMTGGPVLSGTIDSAIVEAVRLSNTRRYPKDSELTTSFIDVSAQFPATTTFQCSDANEDCSAEDPYVVLDSNTVSLTHTMPDVGPFQTTVAADQAQAVTQGFVTGVASASLEEDADGTCTGASMLGGSCAGATFGYSSGAQDIVFPSSTNFQEVYVYGIASFDFTDEANNNDQEYHSSTGQRRLAASDKRVKQTMIVNAIQNVYQK